MQILGRKIGGKFAVQSPIGNGAMGAVYRARQIDLDKDVAIKVLHDKHAVEQSFVARFKREAKAASLIDHPNSMRVLDFGQEPDGLLYIAMELLEGPSLHHIIQTESPLETPRIINLVRQILAALAAAHDLQILHRDLKPENIIVVTKKDDEGHGSELVKVCDFGIAKVGSSSADSSIQNAKLTNAGSIVGTPDYMSPEQARGKGEIDQRSDLYSVGVILYEMMTGRTPFKAQTPLGVVLAHLNETPRPPSELAPACDSKLEAICMKALSKSPDDRFASARELRTALADGGGTMIMAAPGDHAPVSIREPMISKRDGAPSKRGLVLADEPELATSATLIQDAPPMSERARPPMTSAMATLMEKPDAPPVSGPSPMVVLLAILALAGSGALYWFKFRPQVAADTATVGTVAPLASPSASMTASAAPMVVTSSITSVAPRASSSPSASASAHAVASSGSSAAPIVTASQTTQASASAAPSATVAAPPAATHVVVGKITAEQISSSEVQAALPLGRFELCYREGTLSRPKLPTGDAKLHLNMTPTSIEASFAGSPELANDVGSCISHAAGAMNITINNPCTADVELQFKE